MSFSKLLNPSSVAVVGASVCPEKVGYGILNNIITGGFSGKIYPVNTKAEEILGQKCYKSITAIPGPVDCAVIVIKRDLVIAVLKECVAKGTKAVILITAGFGETGEEGKKLQREITKIAKDNGITMLGPNSLGLINPVSKFNPSFGQALGEPGSIALISQSGALITAIQDIAAKNCIGFSLIASLGNKASLDEVEFLENLKNDTNTNVVAAYLENIARGDDFVKVAEKVSAVKPVVVLKSGRTQAGARAASSHTGSLAGVDAAYTCAFERPGVIRADSIEHLFDIATAFAYQPLPAGDRIGILTNAGGPGIMMSDAVEMAGLKVAKIDDETQAKLKKVLPAAASIQNPVDILGDAPGILYTNAIDILMACDSLDALAVILTPQTMTEDAMTAQAIVDASRKYKKPVFACFMGADSVSDGVAILHKNRIPQYTIPERCARALKEMVRYSMHKAMKNKVVERFEVDKDAVVKIFESYRANGNFEIGEVDAKAVMRAYKFSVPQGKLATTSDEAVQFANELGYPLVMKISSPNILHKSDVGGVKVGLTNAEAVADAFDLMMLRIKRKMPEADLKGVLLEKMFSMGKEVILGMKRDPLFGPMIMFGLGGIFVEVLKDVTFGLAPLSREECLKMIESVKTYKILKGARGEKASDIDALVLSLLRLSQLVMDFPEIEEIDINPLKVAQAGQGAILVDARIIISRESKLTK